MKREEIERYILKYKDSHSKEAIEEELVKSGASLYDIKSMYNQINSNSNKIATNLDENDKNYDKNNRNLKPSENQGRKTGFKILITSLVIILIGIPILVFIALFISFLDSPNSVLPNKVDLNNNLAGDVSSSYAAKNEMFISFRYMGAKQIKINSSDINVKLNSGSCDAISIRNADTQLESQYESFLNGQIGIIKFGCEGLDRTAEGDIEIQMENPRTSLKIPSTGTIRLNVVDFKTS